MLIAYRRAARHEPYRLTGAAAPLAIKSQEHGRQPGAFIAGFVRGPDSTPAAVYPPPKVPANYQPVHKFTEPLRAGITLQTCAGRLWPLHDLADFGHKRFSALPMPKWGWVGQL